MIGGVRAVVRGSSAHSENDDILNIGSYVCGNSHTCNHKVGGSAEPESTGVACRIGSAVRGDREILGVVDATSVGADLAAATLFATRAAVVDVGLEVATGSGAVGLARGTNTTAVGANEANNLCQMWAEEPLVTITIK